MAERKITTRLVLSGEQEYNQKLKNVNAELRVAKTGLESIKQKYSENANSLEALNKKQEALTRVLEAQQGKVEVLKNALANAKNAQSEWAQKVQDAQQKVSAQQKVVDDLANTVGESSDEYKEAKAKLDAYNEELKEAEQAHQLCTNAVNNWQSKLNTAEAQQDKTNKEIQKNKQYINEAKNSTDKCATSINSHGKALKASEENLKANTEATKKNSEAINTLATVMVSSGVKQKIEDVAKMLYECVEAADEFEAGMAKVETIADKTADMGKMSEEILALSSTTGKSAKDLTEAAYQAISASVDTADAVGFVGDATKLSVAGFTESSTAVDILTTAINAYRLKSEDAARVSDMLITTQNLGKTTVADLGATMGTVIPTASAYNVQLDNLSSSYVILTRNGINTANASTYLSGMMTELGDEGSAVSKILKEKTGKSFAELMSEGKTLGDVMGILSDSVGGNTTKFANLWSNVRAGRAALSIAQAGTEEYNEVMKAMGNSAGATEAAYKIMTDTAEFANQRLQTSFQNLKIAIGEQLSPSIAELENCVSGLTEKATEIIRNHPEIVAGITAVAIGVGVLTGAVVAYNAAVKLAAIMTEMFNAVIASNPAGMVAIAIAALVAAIVAFVAIAGNAETAGSKLRDESKELKKEVEEATAAYEESSETYRENANAITDLMNRVSELADKEHRTAEEKKELASLVDELNSKVPDLGLEYNQLTDTLNMTTEAIEKMSKAQAAQEAYDAAIERRTELYGQQEQAEQGLAEASSVLAEHQAKIDEEAAKGWQNWQATSAAMNAAGYEMQNYAAAQENLQDVMDQTNAELEKVNTEIGYYGLMLTDMGEGWDEVYDSLAAGSEAGAAMGDTISGLNKESQDLLNTTLEEIDALGQNSEAWQESVDALSTITEQHTQNSAEIQEDILAISQEMQNLQAEYDKSVESAQSSIDQQMGLFDEMNVGVSESIDEMMANLDSQLEYMESYSENLAIIAGWGADSLVSELSDGSAESAAVLQELVNSGESKTLALNQKLGKVKEGKESFAREITDTKMNFSKSMGDMEARLDTAVGKMNKENEAYTAGVNTIQGYLNGSERKRSGIISKFASLAAAATSAFRNALDINSPSKVFEDSGKYTIEGAELGAESRRKSLMEKYSSMARAAFEAFEKESEKIQDIRLRGGDTLVTALLDPEGKNSSQADLEGLASRLYYNFSSAITGRQAGNKTAISIQPATDNEEDIAVVTEYVREYLPYLHDIAKKDPVQFKREYSDTKTAVVDQITLEQKMRRRAGGK